MAVNRPECPDRRKETFSARIPRLRLRMGSLFAEIINDRRADPERIVHCVIQRDDSPEILFLGQFTTREEAEESARQLMSEYLSQQRAAGNSAA